MQLPVHNLRMKPALKKMAACMVAIIESLGVHTVQQLHAQAQIVVGRFSNQVVVIAHLAKSMHSPIEAIADKTKNVEPISAVYVVAINGLTAIAA